MAESKKAWQGRAHLLTGSELPCCFIVIIAEVLPMLTPVSARGYGRPPCSAGCFRQEAQLSQPQCMQPLQIESQADQPPLPRRRRRAPQRELAEAQHLFDDADDRLDRAFPQPI